MVQRTNGDKNCEAISPRSSPCMESPNLRGLQATIRGQGLILARVHQLVERELCVKGEYEQAELVRDVVKPLVDWMLHFDLTEALEEAKWRYDEGSSDDVDSP